MEGVMVALIGALGLIAVAFITTRTNRGVQAMRKENRDQHTDAKDERAESEKRLIQALDIRLAPIVAAAEEAKESSRRATALLGTRTILEDTREIRQEQHRLSQDEFRRSTEAAIARIDAVIAPFVQNSAAGESSGGGP